MKRLEERRSDAADVINQLKERCNSSFITRDKVGELTGGAISSRHLANLDCDMKGPTGAFKIGRKQCYPIDSFCEWLIKRLEV